MEQGAAFPIRLRLREGDGIGQGITGEQDVLRTGGVCGGAGRQGEVRQGAVWEAEIQMGLGGGIRRAGGPDAGVEEIGTVCLGGPDGEVIAVTILLPAVLAPGKPLLMSSRRAWCPAPGR